MKKIVSLVMILALAGCATIVKGTKQGVNVSTNPPMQANCMLTDKQNKTYSLNSPGRVVVNRGDGPLQVTCNSNNAQGSKVVEESLNEWWDYNWIFWIAAPITFIGDAMTGAYQTYPQDIEVPVVGAASTPSFGLNNAQ